MEYAQAYLRNNELFLHGLAETKAGTLTLIEPYIKVDISRATDVGEQVLKTISAFKTGIERPKPETWDHPDHPFLVLARTKSWAAFNKSAKSVLIRREGANITLTPSRRVPRSGFLDMVEKERTVGTQPSEIGSALVEAFSNCE